MKNCSNKCSSCKFYYSDLSALSGDCSYHERLTGKQTWVWFKTPSCANFVQKEYKQRQPENLWQGVAAI